MSAFDDSLNKFITDHRLFFHSAVSLTSTSYVEIYSRHGTKEMLRILVSVHGKWSTLDIDKEI